MYSDYHIHTSFSGDCETPPEAQIEKALSLEMSSLCITDHMDIGSFTEDRRPMEFSVPDYWNRLTRLQKEYEGRIDVRIGMELGLEGKYLEKALTYEKSAPFDYVIGSIHIIDGYDPYLPGYFEDYGAEKGYRRYFECCLEEAARFDCYDCFGHIDYILRYGPYLPEDYPHGYMDQIDPLLRLLIEKGKGIECNTCGLRRSIAFPNPHPVVLKRYRELGGEILCLGSDAHQAPDVGGDFLKAAQILKDCGFRYYTVFKNRKPEFLPL